MVLQAITAAMTQSTATFFSLNHTLLEAIPNTKYFDL